MRRWTLITIILLLLALLALAARILLIDRGPGRLPGPVETPSGTA